MKHSFRAKKSAIVISLLLVLMMVLSLAIPKLTKAAAGSTPPHTKLLTDNHDGTYTLSLDVVGESERKPNPVNVTVILDHSGSMDTRTGGYGSQTRMAAAQNAVNNLARSLFNYNTTEFPELVEMALVGFSTTGAVTQNPTNSYSTFSGAVNRLDADGGTNWEDALQDAAGINYGDTDPTYVIFVSDGNPTFRNTRGNYNPLDNYYYNTYGVYGNGSDTQAHQNIPVATTIARCYEHAVDDATSLAEAVGADHFYTIGAYGNVDRMRSLTTDAGAPAGNYFSAANTTDLQNALASILAQIEKAGIGSVEIEDGTTNQVTASSGVVELLEVDTSSFKYYKDGEEWADAPEAQFVDGAVEWDLSSVGVLDDGVKYTVTFDCYPSQYTYDTIAQLKNGDIEYDDLDPEIQRYIVDNGNGTYSLRTNTTATLDWDDTRTDADENAVAYANPDPVRTDSATMSVSKKWENELDARAVGTIDMTVLMDEDEFTDVTLSDPEWTVENIYISPGIIKNGQVLPGAEGHDFTFAELGPEQYNWELVSPVVHPMLIDGVLTMLTMVDENHPAPAGADTYTINNKTYYSNGTSSASLDAYNYRRSNLNLTKVVTGEDAPEDATFPFTLTVNNSKAANGSADDTNSDYYVWFSIYDTNVGAAVMDANVSGATGPSSSGYYYAPSGTPITVDMKDGWNLRFTNLPTGTTYTFAEGNLATGFAFNNAELTSGEDTTFSGGKTTTGTVENTNTSYVVTYTNDYELTDLEITKVWVDGDNQDGIRLTADELKAKLTLSPAVNGAEPTIVDNGDGTYTITYTGLPRFSNGQEVTYTVTESEITGYSTTGSPAEDHGTITNTHEPEVTSVKVVKVWDDDDDLGGIRPDSITVQLTGDGESVGDPVTLPADGEWEYTWEDLPKYNDGEEIEYSADETAVPAGYDKTGPVKTEEDGTTVFTVTNTYNPTPVTASFPVKKVMEVPEGLTGPNPWSYAITVTANDGAPEATTMSGNVTNTADTITIGTFTFDAPGTYTYTVTEEGTYPGVTNDTGTKTVTIVVEDDGEGNLVIASISADAQNPVVFTNTYEAEPTEAQIEASKELEGRDLEDGEFSFQLIDADGTVLETVTNQGGKVTFTAIEYDKEGTYTYTIKEVKGNLGGVTYDEQEITVTVTVVDNGDGTMTATVAYDPEDATFVNTYEPAPTEAVIEAAKVLDGRTLKDGEFSFQLIAEDGTVIETVTNEGGEVTFSEIEYEEAGTYTYTIKEVKGNLGGVTYDESTINVTVTVVDNGDGTMTATVLYDPEDATFTNVYEADGAFTPEVTKVLTGKDLEAEMFTFELKDAEGNVIGTATNDANGNVVFDEITYDLDDVGKTFTYTVTEVNGGQRIDGITYDDLEVTITVTVTDNGDGTLVVTPVYSDDTEFNNEYTVDETEIVLSASKTLKVDPSANNAPDVSGKYTLTLMDEEGNVIDTQVNPDGDGTKVDFSKITYTEPGVYTYTITEEGNVPGVVNGTTSYTVVVTVVDNGDGTMTATITEGSAVTAFENTYKTNPTEIVLSASKTLEVASGNNAPDVSGQYTLTLKDAEGNVIDTQVNPDGDGTKVDFSKLTYDKPGTYVYTVTEEGTVAGVTNGTTEYTVTVTVTDDGQGNLVAEVTGGSQVTNFVNTYSAEPVKYDPPVRKEYIIPEGLTGIDIEDAFEFTIEATSGPDGVEIPMPENTTIRNNSTFLKDGEVDIYEFGWITFTVPGTYVYTVKESGSVDGVTNDAEAETGKTITVVVTDDGEGHLVAEVTPSETTLTFTNEYGADPVKAAPEAAKSLEGRKLRNGEFTFELVDENGEVIETVKNDADGAVKFSEIEYTMPGTYKYTIREVVGDNEKITYDTETISVTVTVTDNQHGKLVAEVTYGEKTIFVNTYTPDPTEANISVNKALTGRDLEAGEFTFTLTEVDENGNPVKKPVVTEKKADETTDKKADETTDEKAPEIQDSAAVVTGTGKAFVELETVGEKKIVETPETETEAETEVETEAETEVQTEAETEAQTEAEKETEAETEVQTEAETEAEKETEAETEAEKETETEKETEAEKEVEETKDEVIADDEKKAEEEEKAAEIETVEQVPGLTLTATNDAAGLVNFETISYDEAGTYYYKITEDSGSLGGVTYDTSEIIVKVVVTYDDVEGVYIAEVIYPEDKEFNNTYVPEPVKVQPEADKNLTGRDLNEGEFSFQLLDEDGNVVETVKNAADGSITFSEITYDKTGTYKYTIVEVNDGLGGVTYDEGKVEVTVTVTDNLKGNLVAEVLYSAKKTFDNTYVPAPVKIAPETKKTLEGRDLNADEFSFSLLDGDGNLVENVKNAADGTVKFSDITFDKVGTYTFTISETIGELGGVTYDTQTITVTVTVTDDLKGNLVAEISYSQTDGFTNTYEAEGEYTPSVTKALTGKALEEGQFTFELYDSEGNKLQTKTNAVSGKVTFDALSFTQEDVGKTFTYTIVEIDDEQKFVTYDKHVETLTVTVADNGDGTLDVTGTYSGGGSFKNTYQPPTYSIKVEKRTVSKPKDGKAYKEGETIKYEIVVTNDGEGTLKNVVVEDELTGAKWTIAELKPGESKTYTTSYVVTKADAEAKKVLNEVTAKADTEDPDKPYVEDDASVEDPTDVEKETPKTGDESKMLVWVIVMLSGMCGLVGMMLVDDKRKVRR